MQFEFEAPLFRWEARVDADWYFVAVPDEPSAMIREIPRPARGFGSVRVEAVAGGMRWRTSIFPGGAGGAYVLPIKRAVREVADVGEGDLLAVALQVREG